MDGADSLICLDCKSQLLSFYKFRKQCKQSDSTLRKYFDSKSNLLQIENSAPISTTECKIEVSFDNVKLEDVDIKCDPTNSDDGVNDGYIENDNDNLTDDNESKSIESSAQTNKKNTKQNLKRKDNDRLICQKCGLENCDCNKIKKQKKSKKLKIKRELVSLYHKCPICQEHFEKVN